MCSQRRASQEWSATSSLSRALTRSTNLVAAPVRLSGSKITPLFPLHLRFQDNDTVPSTIVLCECKCCSRRYRLCSITKLSSAEGYVDSISRFDRHSDPNSTHPHQPCTVHQPWQHEKTSHLVNPATLTAAKAVMSGDALTRQQDLTGGMRRLTTSTMGTGTSTMSRTTLETVRAVVCSDNLIQEQDLSGWMKTTTAIRLTVLTIPSRKSPTCVFSQLRKKRW